MSVGVLRAAVPVVPVVALVAVVAVMTLVAVVAIMTLVAVVTVMTLVAVVTVMALVAMVTVMALVAVLALVAVVSVLRHSLISCFDVSAKVEAFAATVAAVRVWSARCDYNFTIVGSQCASGDRA
jgi:hypothetical protein